MTKPRRPKPKPQTPIAWLRAAIEDERELGRQLRAMLRQINEIPAVKRRKG